MKINRRELIAGAAAAALPVGGPAAAWPRRGVLVDIGHGWNTLPLGAGGLINGFDFAPDGTLICWTDVGNCYRWSGTIDTLTNPNDKWIPLFTSTSLGGDENSRCGANVDGSIAMAIAYSQTTRFMASFSDIATGTNPNVAQWYLWYTNNSGASWTKSDLVFLNQDSTGASATGVFGRKFGGQRLVIDPNNADYAYFGMTRNSGKGAGCFKTINGGVNWTKVKLSPGGSDVADTTLEPGCCGICFDNRQGTIVNGAGHTVTKRIIVPIGGVGIYESNDGGDNWTETWVSAGNSATFAPYKGRMDYDGTYYMFYTTDALNCRMARYRTVANGGPDWLVLSTGSKWPYLSTISLPNNILLVDPRDGHQGEVAICMGGGIGAGFNHSTGNIHTTATLSNIEWRGATSSRVFVEANSYDIPWQDDLAPIPEGSTTFLSSTEAKIAPDGRVLWSGFRGFWWYDTTPNFGNTSAPGGVAGSTANNPTNAPIRNAGRGIEETVTEYICCAPGGTYPVMATQDVGVMRGTFTGYPQAQYVHSTRPAGYCVNYAAGNNSCIVARVTNGSSVAGAIGNNFSVSAYSLDSGANHTWVPFETQTPNYDAEFNCTIGALSNNSTFSLMTINSMTSGTLEIGSRIYDPAGPTLKGIVIGFTSGTYGGAAGSQHVLSVVETLGSMVSDTSAVTNVNYKAIKSVQSDGLYNAAFNCSIPAASAGKATMTVNSMYSGNIVLGTQVYDTHDYTVKLQDAFRGSVIQFIGGSTGGVGDYLLDTSAAVAGTSSSPITNTNCTSTVNNTGGSIVAVDADHIISVPYGTGGKFISNSFAGVHKPVYTANGTSATSRTWNFCAGLPLAAYGNRGNVINAGPSRPFAVGYGSDLGTIWAACIRNTQNIFKVEDNGSGKCRVTVAPSDIQRAMGYDATQSMVDGSWRALVGVTGTPLATLANQAQSVDVINATQFDLPNLAFSGTFSQPTQNIRFSAYTNTPIVGDVLYATGTLSSGAVGTITSVGASASSNGINITIDAVPAFFEVGDIVRIGSTGGSIVGTITQLGNPPTVSAGTLSGCDIFKSTDNGANFSLVGSVPMGPTASVPYLFTVPGYPGHLWVTARYTSGVAVYNKLWRSTDSGVNWTAAAMPTGQATPAMFCLGAPETPGNYPTLFFGTLPQTTANPVRLYYSQHGDHADITVAANLNWTVLGNTGYKTDMPPLISMFGLTGIIGDWNVFKRLYGVASSRGNVYYNP